MPRANLRVDCFSSLLHVVNMASSNTHVETPWHTAFPSPRSTMTASITREALLERIKLTEDAALTNDFILIDLRRNDYVVCNGLDSAVCERAGIPNVIGGFH